MSSPPTAGTCARRTVIAKLVEANHADRKELDWQGQFDALVDGRRLARNHGDVLRAGAGAGASLHDFVRAATPAIDALRSTTAKGALGLFQVGKGAHGAGYNRGRGGAGPHCWAKVRAGLGLLSPSALMCETACAHTYRGMHVSTAAPRFFASSSVAHPKRTLPLSSPSARTCSAT